MAGEETGESISVTVPRDVVDWLDEQAAASDADREAVVRELLAAHRSIASENGTMEGDLERIDLGSDVDDRLEEQRDEYMDLIQDVRERVIQVKREADRKAPADHDHTEIATATDRLSEIESTLADLEGTVTEVEGDLENGFQNYEDVLRYLKDRTESLEDTLDTLGTAVIDVRSAVERVAAESASRSQADRLKQRANERGFREADCEECGSTVDLSLLSSARCPHCSATFVDVQDKNGFFGSRKLETGSAPALEGDVATDDDEDDLSDIVETDENESVFEWHDEENDRSS